MKLTMFFLVFLLVVSTSYAGDLKNFCKGWSGVAEHVMKARQVGVPLSEVMEKGTVDGASPTEIKLTEEIIISAYEQPRYQTSEQQKLQVERFRDEFYLYCIKNTDGD